MSHCEHNECGETRMRLEFIVQNSHHKLAFQLWVGAILACEQPNLSHQARRDGVGLYIHILQQLDCFNVSL